MQHYKVVTIVHDDGERLPMIIDLNTARPDDHALGFLISNHRNDAPNTILRVAENIAQALEWGRIFLPGEGLVGRCLSGEAFSSAEIYSLSEFLRTSRRRKSGSASPVVCPETHLIRLLRAEKFCIHVMQDACARLPLSDPRSKVFQERINRMQQLFADHRPSTPVPGHRIRSLAQDQVGALLEVLEPDRPRNPFAGVETQVRNRCIVETMLYTGIRPSELLGLRVQDIQFGNPSNINIVRRPHAPDDPRILPAQVKRKGRIVPIAHSGAAAHLSEYMQSVRPKLEAAYKRPTALVFLATTGGQPLSIRSIQRIFEKLRFVLPEVAPMYGISASQLTPMCMRHTFSNDMEEYLLREGIDEDGRRQILMQLRGDDAPDSVEPYIQRSREKQARKHILARQEQVFEKQKLVTQDVPF